MNQGTYSILSNIPLRHRRGPGSVWKMVLAGDTSCITAPGQFINIAVPGHYLRRPISICDWDKDTLTIVYRVAGVGTGDLSSMEEGGLLDGIAGCGSGFDVSHTTKPLLAGGGVGLPPMLGLARVFVEKGINPVVAAGFGTAEDIVLMDEFRRLGIEPEVATVDGSAGAKGTVMELLGGLQFDKFFACGPKPMLKAFCELPVDGEVSMEERMGCGFGVCMGCSIRTKSGMKRVCTDGPVFRKEDMIW